MNKKKLFSFILLFSTTILGVLFILSSKSTLKINYFTKSDTSENTYSVYDNLNNYFQTPSPSPMKGFDFEVDNVEQLYKSNFQLGNTIKTSGYYTANDGGGALYKIVKKQAGMTYFHLIPLKNGLYASMLLEDNTASVKQFGAKGDGITDDSSALNTAFNSKIKNITVDTGNYLCTQPINISTDNLNIIGTDATLFTNNKYREGETSTYDAFFNIVSSSNISMSGITIEARETKRVGYIVQFSIRYAENIHFNQCKFIIPNTVLSEESNEAKGKTAYCNGDVFTAWHNITIENCTFEQLSDTNIGGVIGFRDIYKKGCDNAIFQNNTCIYDGHDEMLAVVSSTDSTVKNVTIQNNEFTVLPGTLSKPRTMCFTIGYDDNYVVDNIKFSNNKIDGYADFSFMTFGNASNVEISKNKINFHRVTNDATPYYFYCTKPTATSNIMISDNTMNFESNKEMLSISFGSLYLKGNTITLDAAISSSAFYKSIAIKNNQITFHHSVKSLTNGVLDFTDNTVIFKKSVSQLYEFYNITFSTDCMITNNKLQFDSIQNDNCTLLLLNGTTLNNHILTYTNNSTMFAKNDISAKTLYMLSINDKNTQTIKIQNNTLNNFTKRFDYTTTGIVPNIVFEKNTVISSN